MPIFLVHIFTAWDIYLLDNPGREPYRLLPEKQKAPRCGFCENGRNSGLEATVQRSSEPPQFGRRDRVAEAYFLQAGIWSIPVGTPQEAVVGSAETSDEYK